MLGSVLDFDPGKVGAVSPVRLFPRVRVEQRSVSSGDGEGCGARILGAACLRAERLADSGGESAVVTLARRERPRKRGRRLCGATQLERSGRLPLCLLYGGLEKDGTLSKLKLWKEAVDNICSLVLIRKFVVASL